MAPGDGRPSAILSERSFHGPVGWTWIKARSLPGKMATKPSQGKSRFSLSPPNRTVTCLACLACSMT